MKTTASLHSFEHWCCLGAAGLCLLLAGGCSLFNSAATPVAPGLYSLDPARSIAPTTPRALQAEAPTLVVSSPRAAAGFDSRRIIYVRQPHRLEYFAHSEWVDTPARMLSPLVVEALEESGAFRAVVNAQSSASNDLRLDTEVLQLQQEFNGQPSRVRFALRAHLVEVATRRVIAARDFEEAAAAPSDDPYGGVVAANQAVRTVLENLAVFCAEAAGSWRAGSSGEKVGP